MKVLIAEDDPVCARALRRALGGAEVVDAADGLEAWDRLRADPAIRMVVASRGLPGLDGLGLCARARSLADRPYTYLILRADRADRAGRLEAMAAGVDDVLDATADPDELAARLEVARRLLAGQEALGRRALELEADRDRLTRENVRLAEEAATDSLTGLKNRRAFLDALEQAASLSDRHNLPLSAVILDVDRFKRYNDAFGHPAGDEVLRAVARVLRGRTRGHDVVARHGGEEFALLLPATDARAAVIVCERLRAAIEAGPWPLRPVTASFGVATRTDSAGLGPELLAEADRALYRAKAEGRNRVVHFDATAAPAP